jgi:tRNA A37 threonylcarbamoyltransferase TsaD
MVLINHLEAHCLSARHAGLIPSAVHSTEHGTGHSTLPSKKGLDRNPSPTPVADIDKDTDTEYTADTTTSTTTTSTTKAKANAKLLQFPFLVLMVSGGHTCIAVCHGVSNYTVLGGTLDDALGEYCYCCCF